MGVEKSEFGFAIVGAGAIGSILGAHLARAGHSVVMLARGNRARQVVTDGLHITGLVEFSTPVRVLCDATHLRSAEVLIIAMKMPGTADALASLRHVKLGAVFSIQNGPLKNELLTDVFGEQRVLGSLADVSGEMLDSGEIVFTRNVNVLVGEMSGEASPRAQHIAGIIDASGVRAAASENIQNLEWSKFAAWGGLMALSVTTRATTWSYLTDPGSARVIARLVREMGLLTHALGIDLTDKSVLPVATICRGTEEDAIGEVIKVGRGFEINARQHRMSSLQDLLAGRPLEIHETIGYALQKATHCRIALPLLDALYHLLSAIDRTRFIPGTSKQK